MVSLSPVLATLRPDLKMNHWPTSDSFAVLAKGIRFLLLCWQTDSIAHVEVQHGCPKFNFCLGTGMTVQALTAFLVHFH